MRVDQIYKTSSKVFSFELFPPKTLEAETSLFKNLEAMALLHPSFISVTMGAMGSNQRNTFQIVEKIERDFQIPSVAHLTCVGASKEKIMDSLEELQRKNLKNILCLRGDPPKGSASFIPPKDGFRYARDLVAFVREKTGEYFSIGVAGYPEGHLECPDKEADLEHLKEKVDAGADYILTQLFFDNADYFSWIEKARKKGISVPIAPGILPLTHYSQLGAFIKMCGAKIPFQMNQALEKIKDQNESVREYGVSYAVMQCKSLLQNGSPGLHFYTLNQSASVSRILQSL